MSIAIGVTIAIGVSIEVAIASIGGMPVRMAIQPVARVAIAVSIPIPLGEKVAANSSIAIRDARRRRAAIPIGRLRRRQRRQIRRAVRAAPCAILKRRRTAR